jgi:hypothetical protein
MQNPDQMLGIAHHASETTNTLAKTDQGLKKYRLFFL